MMVPTMRTLAGALLAVPAVTLLVSAAVTPVASAPSRCPRPRSR
jgi:hypothetical protein